MAYFEFQNLGAHARRKPWEASNFYDILGVPQDVKKHPGWTDEAFARGAVNIATISEKMNKYTSLSPTCWSKDPAVCERFGEIVQAYTALRAGTTTDTVADTDRDPYIVLGVARSAQSSDVDVAFKNCLLSIPNRGRIPECDLFMYATLYDHGNVMKENSSFWPLDDVVAFEKNRGWSVLAGWRTRRPSCNV